MNATVVSLINRKGGVGKTSCTYHIAGTLAREGRRILLLDNDPQANLSAGFFGTEGLEDVEPGRSIAALYDPSTPPIPGAVIRPTPVENVWLVPGSAHLDIYNQVRQDEWGVSLFGLRDFLAECRADFDVVMIDCAPTLLLASWAALVAADGVVVPIQCEDFGAQGLAPILSAVEAVKAGPNPSLRLLGFLISMFDKRLGIHLAYEAQLRGMYGADVFTTAVPLAKDYKEAVAARTPVSHYKPKSAAAKAVKAVAGELLERAGVAEAGLDARRVA
jgi:chromosome partitioning protein